MKTLTPTNLIAVEVPKDAKMYISEMNYLCNENTDNDFDGFYLEDDFKILGEVTDTEISFDLKKLDQVALTIKQAYELLDDWDKIDFRKLLQYNGLYFENPMGKNRPSFNDYSSLIAYQGDCKEFDEFESKLIKGKLIILKPI